MQRLRNLRIFFVCFSVSACSPWVLDPAGRIGQQERIILLDSLAIMLAIVVPTILATLAFAYWFREGNGRAQYLPKFTYSGRLELLVWSIPTLVILFLGGIIWVGSHDLDPGKPLVGKPLDIEVVAMDWKWLFLYPQQGIASVNQLVVPAGTALHFRLTSASVFNSFFIPRIGSQIYAMPGMASELYLAADRVGVYHGLSAQFSGDGFSSMGFAVHAVPPLDFDRWVSTARRAGPDLDAAAYHSLLGQSADVAPHTFRTIMPGLFDAVVRQAFSSGLGPVGSRRSPAVRPIGGH